MSTTTTIAARKMAHATNARRRSPASRSGRSAGALTLPWASRSWYPASSASSAPRNATDSVPAARPMSVAGITTRRIWGRLALSGEGDDEGRRHRRHRRRDQPLLRRDHGDRERPLGTDAGLARHLGDHGEERVDHVLGARGQDQQVGDEGCEDGDPPRIAAEDPLREADDEVEAARRLQQGEGGDDGEDHPQHRARRVPRRKPEQEDEDEEPEATHRPQRHAPPTCAQDDGGQEDRELDPESHHAPFVVSACVAVVHIGPPGQGYWTLVLVPSKVRHAEGERPWSRVELTGVACVWTIVRSSHLHLAPQPVAKVVTHKGYPPAT